MGTPKSKKPAADTIDNQRLCVLTGLSSRRHKQLAVDGYAVSAGRGKFAFTATIRGIFRFYQERSGSKISDLVRFEAHRKLKLQNDQNAGTLILVTEVEKQLHEIASGQLKILRQRLENEWPVAVAGMDPAQARVYGKRLVDEICAQMRKLVEKWKD